MRHRKRFELGASSLLIYFLVSLGFVSGSWAQEPFYKGKTIRIIVGFTPGGLNDRWARFMEEFKTPDIARRVVQVMLAGGELGRPLLVSPGTPQERLKLLREAYSKMLKDPEILDEAKKQKLEVDPSTGEELEALVKQIMEQPKEVIDRVKKLTGK